MRWDYGILLSVICLAATIGVVGAASLSDAISTGKTVADVSQIKAIEISKNTSVIGMVSKPTAAGGITVNIEKIWTDKSGRLCVKYTASDKGGERAVINPTCIYNPPIMVQTGSFFTEDPKAALVSVLVRNAATRPYGKARGGDGDPTFISYATYDRQLRRNITTGTTFSDLVTGSGVISSSGASPSIGYLTGTVAAGNYTDVWRYGVTFNTTPILSNSTVTSALVSTFGSAKYSNSTDALMLVSFSPSNKLSYTASDYNIANWGNTPLAPNISYSSFSTTAYNNYTLSDSSYITKEGYTAIGLRSAADVNQIPYPWSSGQYRNYNVRGVTTAGTTQDPFITIDYTEADITPPGSITDIINQSLSCNTVDFSWTNPTDADYGGLMIWQNNTALSNLPNSSTYVNWTGLPGDADITFSSKTVDLLGNINATFVNMTAHTAVCPSPTRTVSPTLAPDTCDIEIPWCYTQNVFFWNLSSADVSGYQVLENYPELNNTAYQKVSISSATGSKYLGQWIVPLGTFTETKTIAPGLWRFRTYHNVSSQVGVSTVEFKVFNRSASGNETDLFYGLSITKDVNELTPTEYLTSYARRNYTTFYPGDRLVIKMNASTTSVTARDVWVSTAGNAQASMVEIGWFVCCDDGSCACGTGGSGGEAVGAAFGIIGGILGAIIIFRRRGEMQ